MSTISSLKAESHKPARNADAQHRCKQKLNKAVQAKQVRRAGDGNPHRQDRRFVQEGKHAFVNEASNADILLASELDMREIEALAS